jgi:hypothetical protein
LPVTHRSNMACPIGAASDSPVPSSRSSVCHHSCHLTTFNLFGDWKPSTGSSRMESLQNRTIDPPTKLTRFAPDGRDWVLYDTAQENDFLSWWLQTDYGQQLSTNGRSKVRWSAGSRSSEVWKHFDQVAELRSGRPKVICRSCLTSLNHPHHKFHGTSAMGKHLKSKIYRRSKRKVSFSAVTLSPVQEARAVFSPKSTFTKAQLELCGQSHLQTFLSILQRNPHFESC